MEAAQPPAVPSLPQIRCRNCAKLIDAGNKFCPSCGQRQTMGDSWYYRPVWIAVLACFALGPLALILVWKSSLMSRRSKLLMAAIVLAYTALCGYYVYAVVSLELGRLVEFNRIMYQINVR